MHEFHIHAEYCPGPFYMGWWLYVDAVLENVPWYQTYFGIPQDVGELASAQWRRIVRFGMSAQELRETQHHWMRYGTGPLRAIAARYGLIVPADPFRGYNDQAAKIIGMERPQGLRVLARDSLLYNGWEIPDWLVEQEDTRNSCWRYPQKQDFHALPLQRFDHDGVIQRSLIA